MRSILVSISILWGSIGLFGQTAEENAIRLKQEGSPVIESSLSTNDELLPDNFDGSQAPFGNNASASRSHMGEGFERGKGHLGINIGTSFTYLSGFGSGMMLYAAPTFTLPLNDRWALHGGIIAAGYQGYNSAGYQGNAMGSGELLMPTQFTSLAMFAAASYRMNDRLVLHGAGVKQLISAPVNPLMPYPANYFSVGATYKLGYNISIGATIHINNGGGYYSDPFHYADPFNRGGFQPPLYW